MNIEKWTAHVSVSPNFDPKQTLVHKVENQMKTEYRLFYSTDSTDCFQTIIIYVLTPRFQSERNRPEYLCFAEEKTLHKQR